MTYLLESWYSGVSFFQLAKQFLAHVPIMYTLKTSDNQRSTLATLDRNGLLQVTTSESGI